MEKTPVIRLEDLIGRMDQLRQSPLSEFRGATHHAQKAFFLAHPLRAIEHALTGPPEEDPVARQQASLLEVDNALLARLYKSGHLTVQPLAMGLSESRDNDWGNHANMAMGHDGRIFMDTQGSGDLYGIPKNTRGEHLGGSGRTFDRWIVLLHEAAHCQMENTLVVFDPTPGKIPEDQQSALSRWAFSILCADRYPRQLLHENYADALGAMLLLEATGHHPEVWDVVKRKRETRFKTGQDEAKHWQEHGDEATIDCHLSWAALDEVIHKSASWRGLPPAQLRERAMEFASNGVLEVASAAYKTPVGIPFGMHLRERISKASFSLDVVLQELLCGNRLGVQNQSSINHMMKGHVAESACTSALDQFTNMLNNFKEAGWRRLVRDALPSKWGERWSSFSTQISDLIEKLDREALMDPVIGAHWKRDQVALDRFGKDIHEPMSYFRAPDMNDRVNARRTTSDTLEETIAPRPMRPV
jgi:hypothetical protein